MENKPLKIYWFCLYINPSYTIKPNSKFINFFISLMYDVIPYVTRFKKNHMEIIKYCNT